MMVFLFLILMIKTSGKREFQHEGRKTISIPPKSKERVSTLYLQYSCTEKQRGREERKVTRHNVIIVSQSTGMGEVSRGVTQFPYICLRALCDGGQREVIDVLLRLWAELTERQRETPTEIKLNKK